MSVIKDEMIVGEGSIVAIEVWEKGEWATLMTLKSGRGYRTRIISKSYAASVVEPSEPPKHSEMPSSQPVTTAGKEDSVISTSIQATYKEDESLESGGCYS